MIATALKVLICLMEKKYSCRNYNQNLIMSKFHQSLARKKTPSMFYLGNGTAKHGSLAQSSKLK